MQISQRLQALKGSSTTQVKQVADQLKRDGVNVCDFGVGEPDFPTPQHIKDAAQRAMNQDLTTYTAARGIVELRTTIAERYNKLYGTQFGPEHVVVSVGAKQSLYNLMLALVNPGDEVVIPAPYWVTYPAQVQLAGGVPVLVQVSESNDFKVTSKDIEARLTDRTKVVNLNSPNNPTGAVIEPNELHAITALCAANNITLLFDECYECFVYGKSHSNPLQWDQEHVIAIGSASKSYAMTGWRIGWAIGPKDALAATDRLQSQSTSNPNSIAQWAAIEALSGDQSPVEQMRNAYRQRLDLVLEMLGNIHGLSCPRPEGAFYVFPNVAEFFNDDLQDSVAIAKYLLEAAHVAVVPGSAFGAEGHIRISYAASEETLREGLTKMGEALTQLRS